MKNLQKICFLFSCSLLVLSCTKSNTDEIEKGIDFFTAKIDGTNWTAFAGPPDTVAWNEAHSGLIVLQGSDRNGTAITMNIANYKGVATYDFSKMGFVQYVVSPTQSNSGAWVCNATSGTSGTVKITSDNGTLIEGTLSFVGKNIQKNSTKNITEGKFRATKQ